MKALLGLSLFFILSAGGPAGAASLESVKNPEPEASGEKIYEELAGKPVPTGFGEEMYAEPIKNPAPEASGEEIYAELVTLGEFVNTECLEPDGTGAGSCYVNLNILFPRLRGMKDAHVQRALNFELQHHAGAMPHELGLWERELHGAVIRDFGVRCLDENYISVVYYTNYMGAGARSNYTYFGGLNLSRKTGRRLEFRDLFTTSIGEADALVKTRLRDALGDTDMVSCLHDSQTPCLDDDTPFVFDRDNVYFLFHQGTIGPMALGSLTARVPMDELDWVPMGFPRPDQPPLPSGPLTYTPDDLSALLSFY